MEALTNIGINPTFLLSQIVNFLVLLFILARFVYPPLLNTLQARQERIKESLAEADRVRREAAEAQVKYQQEIEAARREGREAIAAAVAASERVRQEIIEQAHKEAEEIRAAAQRDAEDIKTRAVTEAHRQIADLAILAAQRVVGGVMDEPRQRQMVQEFLATVGDGR